MKKIISTLVSASMLASMCAVPATAETVEHNIYKEIYVSPSGTDEGTGEKDKPFNTVQTALETVKEFTADMDGDIIVHLEAGDYIIDEKIVIDESCSGQNGYKVILKGDGEDFGSVINGGVKISGWKQMDNSTLWEADAPEKFEVMRGLYINGYPATIARTKYLYSASGMYHEADEEKNDGLVVLRTNFPEIKTNPEDVMLVWPILWTCQREPVEEIIYDEANVIIKMVQPYWDWVTHYGQNMTTAPGADKQFFMENAYEFLDEPGEFYYNKKTNKVYYYPYEKEDMTTAEVYAAKSEGLMSLAGTDNTNKLSNFELNNIAFKYGAYNEVDEKGARFTQTDSVNVPNENLDGYKEVMFPAQVSIDNADNVTVKGCSFTCLGSNALNLENSVINSSIVGNRFTDIAGTAIEVGSFNHKNTLPDGIERVENIEVSNNVIRRSSYEYIGNAALALYYVKNVQVANNDIKDVPYSGIVVGWGWGNAGNVDECRDITVTGNRVTNVTSVRIDGAHVYTLGKMDNTYITRNYFDLAGNNAGGIYLDEGSENITVEENVVTRGYLWLNARPGAKLKNNVVKNNYTNLTKYKADPDNVKLSETSITALDAMPVQAQKIMDESGVKDEYKYLLEGAEGPEWRIIPMKCYPNAAFTNATIPNTWIEGKDYVNFYEISHAVPDIYNSGVIGETKPGEWLEYEVEAFKTDIYKLYIRGGDGWAEDAVQCMAKIYLDGELLEDAVVIPRNRWNIMDIYVGEYELSEGKHIIRLEIAGNDWLVGGCKIDNGEAAPNTEGYDEGVVVSETDHTKKRMGYTDIIGHWASYDIRQTISLGYMEGYDVSSFGPDDKMTFKQACLLFERMLKKDDENWEDTAKEIGFIEGDEEYDKPVTREKFAAMIIQAYEYKNGEYQLTGKEEAFTDADEFNPKYIDAIQAAKELGIIGGYEDNTFRPLNTLTRAEAATVVSESTELIR